MAAPSTAYLSKFSNSEKTDPTMLLTTHDVGKIFLNLIETSGLRLSEREIQNEAGVSAEALKYFLDSIESKTVGDFKRFLEESGGLKPEGYAKLKKIYGQLRLKSFTWGLYLIDKELLVKRGGIFASPDRPGTSGNPYSSASIGTASIKIFVAFGALGCYFS
ncbi:hypothetical protein N7523_008511 [Penicillium sp. IBT 18751x]|nr:hypothetical protein N7523_008511 [Penicillium sp. IBT 18751x]